MGKVVSILLLSFTVLLSFNTYAHTSLPGVYVRDKQALKDALIAYDHAKSKGRIKKPIITLIDYTLPSYAKRM